ncbi:L-threonine 3-dehydrogenase [Wickerhamomyces ciferrii]|uniref:L-threonine 3-dehydrogenase n=1 Tax=Wickerhamomyces ciferrii (strain ATCC 14091 / BCRC 22168 / CBS 111 / JCM 3599 / NBRC 0793 / NRRL Y-1031 F-60-10) TaxID=1206466 RepID=K0KNY8_WICCF|nr:L-threonine 3-dehydrogenase [Wickerhamomyces ciferrii]CCH43897.1 L-threonine 3-dehydrogenase [Wickerhamomyces ciferrii]
MCRSCFNPSVQVTVDHKIEIKENDVPQLKFGEVLIHPRATGICGSDIHLWKHGQIGELKVLGNLVLGHEASGDIIDVAEDVTNVKIGDKVAIEPQIPCNTCFLCRQGDYNLCQDVKFIGVYPNSGSMQRYLVHDARYVFKLPENMTYTQGALVEPLSVAYHGVERADLKLGHGVMIAGAGPIGLATLLLVNAAGCAPIVITDLSEGRLKFAKELVPNVIAHKIDVKLTPQETGIQIRKLFGPKEDDAPSRVLECTGVESSVVTCSYTVRRSGILMIIGVGKEVFNNFPFMQLSFAEIDVKFSNRYHDSWPTIINMISSGLLQVDKLITHRFPLERADEAIELAGDPRKGSIKVIVEDRNGTL